MIQKAHFRKKELEKIKKKNCAELYSRAKNYSIEHILMRLVNKVSAYKGTRKRSHDYTNNVYRYLFLK